MFNYQLSLYIIIYIIIILLEKKIATLTRDELKSWAQLDENEGLEDLEETLEDQDNRRPK